MARMKSDAFRLGSRTTPGGVLDIFAGAISIARVHVFHFAGVSTGLDSILNIRE
ncbi:Casein kinase II subunit alpha-2 [Aspergillus niger]|uniref:Casein kinase II subunit alpha-2 n=1 Tax=Aspergillus niger TaxID=5061 RepID=A0A505IFJ4_ASPNG|nr:Casein kinase II subunit alpha-2 [Aspergillus niger]